MNSRLVIRLLVALSGALALLVAARLWLDPAAPAAQLGLQALGGLGTATLRADLGGFFAGAGLFALAGAILADRRWLLTPLVLVALALSGRLITAASGMSADMIMPMAIEAGLAVLYIVGYLVLAKPALQRSRA